MVYQALPRSAQCSGVLTGHGECSRVIEAVQIGVNEFLLKPVSSKALQARMVAVLTKPRPVVKSGDYYGPVAPAGGVGARADQAPARAAARRADGRARQEVARRDPV